MRPSGLGVKDYRVNLGRARILYERETWRRHSPRVTTAIRLAPNDPQCFVTPGLHPDQAVGLRQGPDGFRQGDRTRCPLRRSLSVTVRGSTRRGRIIAEPWRTTMKPSASTPPIRPTPTACRRRAWLRATCPEAELRDAKRAVESAKEACKRTKSSNPDYLISLAAAHAEAGDFESAIEAVEKAQALITPDDPRAEWYQGLLTMFWGNEPYRLPDGDEFLAHAGRPMCDCGVRPDLPDMPRLVAHRHLRILPSLSGESIVRALRAGHGLLRTRKPQYACALRSQRSSMRLRLPAWRNGRR